MYPLNQTSPFDDEQSSHFFRVINLAKAFQGGWGFLEGGPGTGKTFVTSNIQLKLMEDLQAEILAIYPTHAARLVGIQEVIENSIVDGKPTARVADCDDDEPSQHADVILTYNGGRIRFKTIQAALGVKLQSYPGKDPKFEQSFSDAIKARTNFFYKYIFVDEVSMISDEMLTNAPEGAEDKRPIKAGVVFHIEKLMEKNPEFKPIVHFTGDFNQLRPIKGTFAETIFREPEAFDIVTQLTKNHRSGREGIVALIKYILDNGRLPKRMNKYQGVYHLTDEERYQKKFSDTVKKKGGNVLGLSFSNRARMMHSNLAAEAYQQETQFFVGNTLTAAEGKGERIFPVPKYGPKVIVYLYNSEKVKILETQGLVVVRDTEYAGAYAIHAHKVILERCMTKERYPMPFSTEPQFYLIDYLGSKKPDCPKHRYLEQVKKTLNNSLKPLVNKKNVVATLSAVQKMRDVDDLLDFLGDTDEFLGKMVSHYCYDMGKGQVIDRYLHEIHYEPDWTVLFDRVPAGTPCSIFNLMWANMYENINARVLTTRSENAMTCHNAQGSGREVVFLYSKDLKASDPDTMKRLLYVGVSRAKEEITILT